MSFQIAVLTVMTPDLSPEEAAAAARRHGYTGIEWRITSDPWTETTPVGYWSGNRSTLDIDSLRELLPRVHGICRAEGLSVPALGTYLKPTELARIESCMAFAAELDCRQIRVGLPAYTADRPYREQVDAALRDWESVAALASRSGVRANVEIHHGTLCPSASLAAQFVSRFDPKDVGVIHDAGNMAIEGYENWRIGVELLGDYLGHVHAKNVEWAYGTALHGTVRFRPHWTPLQEGVVHWPDVLTALGSAGYPGWIGVEDFSDAPTDRKLSNCIACLKRYLASVESAGQ